MTPFKQALIHACHQLLAKKQAGLQAIMQDMTDAANNETKSTAGDKHETARAMMQLEQEKLSRQISELGLQKKEFDKIDFTKAASTCVQGSCIETDQGFFFIAASLGKLTVDPETVFVISAQSPLAKAFLGAGPKATVAFNGVSYLIKAIC